MTDWRARGHELDFVSKLEMVGDLAYNLMIVNFFKWKRGLLCRIVAGDDNVL